MKTALVAILVIVAAALFGAYRDARATSTHRADTITSLSLQLYQLRSTVSQLQFAQRNDEEKLARICSRSRLVADFSSFSGTLSPVYVYC